VVYNEDSPIQNIQVVLTNGVGYSATIVGSDSGLDLALLRITKKDGETFTVAQFGDSSKLVVGQDVIAIGNPLGSLGGTVTDGIISALDRRIKIGGKQMVVLQHNAAINPGNSGGALFDMMGNLVCIVNAKTSDEGIEGLGFAIPSNIALSFLNRVMVIEPAIGIHVQYGRVSGVAGLYVVEPAGEFKKYDRIIAVNGHEVSGLADYYARIGDIKKGDTVEMTVLRNGERNIIKVVIQ
jgi:serine protease Do